MNGRELTGKSGYVTHHDFKIEGQIKDIYAYQLSQLFFQLIGASFIEDRYNIILGYARSYIRERRFSPTYNNSVTISN